MTAKTQIIEELGADALSLPSLVNEALTANDRARRGPMSHTWAISLTRFTF